jgi:hypothetical protein
MSRGERYDRLLTVCEAKTALAIWCVVIFLLSGYAVERGNHPDPYGHDRIWPR